MINDPGFYANIPYSLYDEIKALRFSDLKHMERSPMSFRYHCDNPKSPTKPMILGHAAHIATLEPATAKFAIWDGGRRFGKAFDEWCAANKHCTQLNVEEADYVFGMALAVNKNPVAHRYLSQGESEVTMVWRDSTFGRMFKARVDKHTEIEGPCLVSLKSTVDCRDFRFSAQYAKMGYAAQDAIYQSGFYNLTGVLPRMVTIAVESKPPFETAVYRVGNDVLREGQQQAYRWVEKLIECEASNRWPAAEEGEQDLSLPSWAIAGGDFEMDDLEPIER